MKRKATFLPITKHYNSLQPSDKNLFHLQRPKSSAGPHNHNPHTDHVPVYEHRPLFPLSKTGGKIVNTEK